MIREHALLPVRPGREQAFEAAFAQARPLIEATPGFVGLSLSRSLESPSTYLLLVEWESVEAHQVGFRGSDRYPRWRDLLHHFYDPFPVVEHFVTVASAGEATAVPAAGNCERGLAAADPGIYAARLRDLAAAVPAARFLVVAPDGVLRPGLYAWWVDDEGAADLSRGAGLPVDAGLIYAGQTGAASPPGGRRSPRTLWKRLVSMHLLGTARRSTFRHTLGALLAEARGWPAIDEPALSAWMRQHLAVVVAPYDDVGTLRQLEDEVLSLIDPPLNLQRMVPTRLRRRLIELRRTYPRE